MKLTPIKYSRQRMIYANFFLKKDMKISFKEFFERKSVDASLKKITNTLQLY